MEFSGGISQELKMSATDTAYIPGTNLPLDGWLQPCESCASTTSRTHTAFDGQTIYICRRCHVPESRILGPHSFEESQILKSKHEEPLCCTTLDFERDRNFTISSTSVGAQDRSNFETENYTEYTEEKLEDLDILCRDVVGEFLLDDSPCFSNKHEEINTYCQNVGFSSKHEPDQLSCCSVSSSPVGVYDAAEVWSDLDGGEKISPGNSPRAISQRKDSSKDNLAPNKEQPSAWICAHADTLYPHDIWHWNVAFS
eukprot:CAMPEP_0196579402 /NCGR_PEP_ID=MMETSP1081-20130531/21582_1 /TAXON_ID=36882 /ORGANISM="Pyramimonas amylifera, Strain CCMP720" /LENGTH=254 /DNA_ID=CAMNT_0041898979 /DNA_START=150 /DNA_END=914 /DNA_ORIENTATION=-